MEITASQISRCCPTRPVTIRGNGCVCCSLTNLFLPLFDWLFNRRIDFSARKEMFVSVVIPAYNAEKYLAEAIESVLVQQSSDLEIIVVDDGSTDGTAAVAGRYADRIRFVRQSNLGVAAARNHGIRLARGEVLGFLDADDCFTADALELQLLRLRRHPEVDIVLGQRSYFSTPAPPDLAEENLANPADDYLFLSFGCSLIRRSVFDSIGFLSESMRFCEDWDWFMRARESDVPLLIHKCIVLHVRLHETNTTRQRELGKKFTLEMFRRSLTRRKAANGSPVSLPPLSSFLEPEVKTP